MSLEREIEFMRVDPLVEAIGEIRRGRFEEKSGTDALGDVCNFTGAAHHFEKAIQWLSRAQNKIILGKISRFYR